MRPEGQWLAHWFAMRTTQPVDAATRGDTNYFDAGWIDSLGIIDLVTEVEEHFGLHFDERHFQDRRFPTINGLASIISELRATSQDGAATG